MGNRHAARRDKGRRFAKTRECPTSSDGVYDVAVKIVTEVRTVRKVKDLKDSLEVGSLSDLEVLSDAHVKLEESLSAGIVK